MAWSVFIGVKLWDLRPGDVDFKGFRGLGCFNFWHRGDFCDNNPPDLWSNMAKSLAKYRFIHFLLPGER